MLSHPRPRCHKLGRRLTFSAFLRPLIFGAPSFSTEHCVCSWWLPLTSTGVYKHLLWPREKPMQRPLWTVVVTAQLERNQFPSNMKAYKQGQSDPRPSTKWPFPHEIWTTWHAETQPETIHLISNLWFQAECRQTWNPNLACLHSTWNHKLQNKSIKKPQSHEASDSMPYPKWPIPHEFCAILLAVGQPETINFKPNQSKNPKAMRPQIQCLIQSGMSHMKFVPSQMPWVNLKP